MAAAVRLFAEGHTKAIAPSAEWQKVEEAKTVLTAETKSLGLRKSYEKQPDHKWPATVWSLSQNLNSSLVPLRATLAALNDMPNLEEWAWTKVQRPFFERPGALKGMAGATVETLGEFTQPFELPNVEVVEHPETHEIQSYKWDPVTDARLRQDPGGICFGFAGLHEQARTSSMEREIKAMLELVDIQLPPRFSSVEMLTMVGALLLPHLGPDYPNLRVLGNRTLTDELIEAQRRIGK
jgi:hypothetical protein